VTAEELRAWADARVATWPVPTPDQAARLIALLTPKKRAELAHPSRKAA
jgi:hypothetical protein